ncbi:MAG: hypothetical protein WCS87_19495 [Methylococcaceae bacterium]
MKGANTRYGKHTKTALDCCFDFRDEVTCQGKFTLSGFLLSGDVVLTKIIKAGYTYD